MFHRLNSVNCLIGIYGSFASLHYLVTEGYLDWYGSAGHHIRRLIHFCEFITQLIKLFLIQGDTNSIWTIVMDVDIIFQPGHSWQCTWSSLERYISNPVDIWNITNLNLVLVPRNTYAAHETRKMNTSTRAIKLRERHMRMETLNVALLYSILEISKHLPSSLFHNYFESQLNISIFVWKILRRIMNNELNWQ